MVSWLYENTETAAPCCSDCEVFDSLLHDLFPWCTSVGEEEELEVEEEEEQKGPDLKLASRRDMYSICQSVGLG